MSGVTTALADVSAALLGPEIDAAVLARVAKMHPDASSVHAPGMLVIAGGRRRGRPPVRKSYAKLKAGYLQQARRLAGTAPRPKLQAFGVGKPQQVGKLDDQTKRKVTAAGSYAGAGVGAFGAGVAVNEIRRNTRAAGGALRTGLKATPRTTRWLLPAEVAGVGIESAAGHILHGDTKKPKVAKGDEPGDITWSGTFCKFDDDKRLAFGWASVVELNGQPVIDRQGDVIAIDEIEKASYDYMLNSRVGGRMHERTFDDRPVHISDVVESVVFTPEKCTAMGISKELSGRWWLGMKVREDDDWQRVKKGEWTGFSIHGRGLRKSTTVEDLMAGLAD
jgi:hypothetical protein